MEPSYRVVPVEPAHIGELTLNVREPDRVEFAALGKTPAAALLECLEDTDHAWAGLRDGEVLCIFGVADLNIACGHGIPWMIGSRLLDEHAMGFLSRCKPALEILLGDYELLTNVVHSKNTRAIRWLKWLGFRILPAEPIGKNGDLFHRFEMRRNDHV